MKEIVQVEVSPGVMDIEPGRAEKAKRAIRHIWRAAGHTIRHIWRAAGHTIRHIWEFIAEYDPFGEIRVSLPIYAFIFFMIFMGY